MRVRTAVVALAALVSLASCSDRTGPAGAIAVSVAATPSPTDLKPGGKVAVTVTATPTAGLDVQYLILTVGGLIDARDSVPHQGPGPLVVSRVYDLPTTISPGEVTVTATAHAGRVTGTGTYKAIIADTGPPFVFSFSMQPDTAVSPGDTIAVSYTVADDFGVQGAVLSWVGADTGSQTLVANNAHLASRIVRVPVPLGPPKAPTITFHLVVTDGAGLRDSAALGPIRVVDETPPAVSGTVSAPVSGVAFHPGDVLRINVSGTDNVKLAWAGYRVAGPAGAFQDSTPVSGLQASASFQLPITAAWVGSTSVRAFLRDAAGYLSERGEPGVLVLSGAEIPANRSLTLAAPIADLAVDESHGLAYALLPDSSRIDIVSLSSATRVATIALPAPPAHLDINPDGSVLAVTLPHSASLLVVSNPATTPSLRFGTVLADSAPNGEPVWLDRVRFASSGHALVTVTFSGSGFLADIYEYDPATGVSAPRSELGLVQQNVQLAPAFDRSKMLAIQISSPALATVFDAATDRFGATTRIPEDFAPLSSSADYSGTLFLVKGQIFDTALSLVGDFAAPAYSSGPSALGPAGFAAYAVGEAVELIRLADDALVGTVALPSPATLLRPLSDGHTLLAASGRTLSVLTLW